jgi:predicted nuclease with RNAse H fold
MSSDDRKWTNYETTHQPRSYAVGWDVGAWHCDRNNESRDALSIQDDYRNLLGITWRGNLRETINESRDSQDFLDRLFALKGLSRDRRAEVTLAIDAPLAFSRQFADLTAGRAIANVGKDSQDNSYLFRATERLLFQRGFRPLSAVQDMIGSQATKAMHVITKFGLTIERCGVWTDGQGLRVIETYPAVCESNHRVRSMLKWSDELEQMNMMNGVFPEPGSQDQRDAFICSMIAYMFQLKYEELEAPRCDIPAQEGWIWYPIPGIEYGKALLDDWYSIWGGSTL